MALVTEEDFAGADRQEFAARTMGSSGADKQKFDVNTMESSS